MFGDGQEQTPTDTRRTTFSRKSLQLKSFTVEVGLLPVCICVLVFDGTRTLCSKVLASA
jgi:hypothetical protein